MHTTFFSPNNNSESIKIALTHAAYARQNDVDALLQQLSLNPELLLQTGDVITPGGLDVRKVTIYEFLLAQGDFEFAKKVGSFFKKIPNGESERLSQYNKYLPFIKNMLKQSIQSIFDIKSLLELTLDASNDDILGIVLQDSTHQSKLNDAVMQFRKEHGPRTVTEPQMHYNYSSLLDALLLLKGYWKNLYDVNDPYHKKIRFAWQLIAFEMRRFPGVDRCMAAQGFFYVEIIKEPFLRSYKCRDTKIDFPDSISDYPLAGLGADFPVEAISFGADERVSTDIVWREYPSTHTEEYNWWTESLLNYFTKKQSELMALNNDIENDNTDDNKKMKLTS